MRMLSRTRRLALIALSVTATGGGVLLASSAHAASAPGHAGVPYIRPLDPGPGVEGRVEGRVKARIKAPIKGRNNAVNQSSPTHNLGNQNNSSVNSGGQHNFQSGQCSRTKICKIIQKNVFKRGLHGPGGHHRVRSHSAGSRRFRQFSSASASASASADSSFSGIALRAVVP